MTVNSQLDNNDQQAQLHYQETPPPKKKGEFFKKETFQENSIAVGSTGKNYQQNNDKIQNAPIMVNYDTNGKA